MFWTQPHRYNNKLQIYHIQAQEVVNIALYGKKN